MTEATTNEKVTEQSPTGRRRLIQALALGLMFVVPLLLAELTVRLVFDVPSPDARRKLALRYQPALFARHIFPATRQRVDKYRINRLGYRGAEFEPAKRPGVIRVMIYGGSQVFDPFCDEEQQWPHRLQLALGALGRRDVEVINAGIPGHASFDSLGRLLTEGHRFSPDVVILDNAWNDIKGFGSRRALLRSLAPYEPKIDRRLVYANRVDRFFSRYSQLYRLLRNAYLAVLDDLAPGMRRAPRSSSRYS